jgi:DNA polymerase II large subunit
MISGQYFEELEKLINLNYKVAEEARKKGFDPVEKVEVPLARNLAEKVVGLISSIYPQLENSGIVKRIKELEEKYGLLDPAVCLQIAEEIAKEKFCKFDSQIEAIVCGARVGFAYITLSVVSSPIEGLTEIQIMKTRDGKEYFSPFYSGPVRSAGGTGAAFSLVIIDHLREIFGYEKYDPDENEVKRTVAELRDYHERVTNLQYFPTEEEIIFLAKNIPIQINGEPSEKFEVSNYKDLDRIGTNFIRSGFCLTFAEGLAQKAPKIKRYIGKLREKGFKLSAWNFLDEFIEIHKKRESGKGDDSPTYIKDLVAGRPIFGHPSRSGAFRFRYGRSRVAGFSAASIHPATMALSDNFIANGTQLKIEKPTKGCVTTCCDSIDGPIVKFKDGSVKKINSFEEASNIYDKVEEIIYFGDILFPFGDLANRNYDLIKPGYVEEWWGLEIEKHEKNIDFFKVGFHEAINYSKKYKIPLHPDYIYFWTQIDIELFLDFLRWLSYSRVNQKIILPYSHVEIENFSKSKRALELLGIPHKVTTENVIIDELNSKALFVNLGLDYEIINKENYFLEKDINKINEKIKKFEEKDVLKIVNFISDFEIKDKAGDFIGSRMGRPEKAKLRKLTGSPHVLFPIGEEGGRFRSVQEAIGKGFVNAEFPIYFCENCNEETIFNKCQKCKNKTKKKYYSYLDKKVIDQEFDEKGNKNKSYYRRKIEIGTYFENAKKLINCVNGEVPKLIKGIRGTSSEGHEFEHLVKGILRAKYNVNVNKDGTIRYDMTELPVTHFKPREVGTSVEKLKEIGYEKDIYGKILENDEQILELKPHDIILPSNVESGDEKADDVFINIANFIDELLERFYKLPKFYNVKTREDLVGKLAVCMAPHNCAGVISRIIGFSKTQGLFASPYMHAAMRRDCDGDEAASMLLLDVLINFSKKYLPSHRGGTQDAPLVLNGRIDAGEVDDQILDFELVWNYPLELYEKAEKRLHSSEVSVELVNDRLKNKIDPFVNIGFTHSTSDFNSGVLCSSYKQLPTMKEKVEKEMEFVTKMRAVDAADVARLIIERHFIRDIRGNLRKFSQQGFRCVKCNSKFRRPPLIGKCTKCGGKIIFTISEGGIIKYLDPALDLARNYNVPVYVKQGIELTKKYIESIFGREETKQSNLGEWFE